MDISPKAKIILTAASIILIVIFVYIMYLIINKTVTPNVNVNKNVSVTENPDIVFVKRVIDGDTIELDNGEKVRYIGINAPETVDTNSLVECYGVEASTKNKELVEGKNVRLEKDISDKDKYGRLLRYVYMEDGSMVNLLLIKEGYAKSSTYDPDIKYQAQIQTAEKNARESGTGLWSITTCSGNFNK